MSADGKSGHIRLTSHPGSRGPVRFPLNWGAATAAERGPVVATVNARSDRNAIGAHGGSYSIYRALAISSGAMDPHAKPDLHDTSPVCEIGPHPQWGDPARIVSLDPWGHRVAQDFGALIEEGIDIRPSIAITKARLTLHEIQGAIAAGRLEVDGDIVHEAGDVSVTKIAVDPVWWLPGVGGMYPELVTRPDLSVFLPPIGGMTLYIFGDPAYLGDTSRTLTCRVHDECNGSDVFGSDICTCRPYLTHGIEEATRQAQAGGTGLIVYNRKEGRALGEVTKFLVYNARKRQPGGDQAATYFERTECVAGVQDARFQQLMPDVIHWLGITRIDRFVSMSNMKYDALATGGVEIGERVPIPDGLVPPDASVEMEAKKAAGYYTPEGAPSAEHLRSVVGRDLGKF
jgi:GTP cyclohydrolase II